MQLAALPVCYSPDTRQLQHCMGPGLLQQQHRTQLLAAHSRSQALGCWCGCMQEQLWFGGGRSCCWGSGACCCSSPHAAGRHQAIQLIQEDDRGGGSSSLPPTAHTAGQQHSRRVCHIHNSTVSLATPLIALHMVRQLRAESLTISCCCIAAAFLSLYCCCCTR